MEKDAVKEIFQAIDTLPPIGQYSRQYSDDDIDAIIKVAGVLPKEDIEYRGHSFWPLHYLLNPNSPSLDDPDPSRIEIAGDFWNLKGFDKMLDSTGKNLVNQYKTIPRRQALQYHLEYAAHLYHGHRTALTMERPSKKDCKKVIKVCNGLIEMPKYFQSLLGNDVIERVKGLSAAAEYLKQSESRRGTPDFLCLIFFLCLIWRDIFNQKITSGTVNPYEDGNPVSGKIIDFIQAAINPLGIENATPDQIREKIKMVKHTM